MQEPPFGASVRLAGQAAASAQNGPLWPRVSTCMSAITGRERVGCAGPQCTVRLAQAETALPVCLRADGQRADTGLASDDERAAVPVAGAGQDLVEAAAFLAASEQALHGTNLLPQARAAGPDRCGTWPAALRTTSCT